MSKVNRGRVLPETGGYYVHTMSRVVDRRFVLGDEEKEYFRKLMRNLAEYSGVELVTYAIMDNHFHLLLLVPTPQDFGDEEVARRIAVVNGKSAAANYRKIIKRLSEQGHSKAANDLREKHLERMFDLSAFMQDLKRRFTRWYNRRNNRTGTLWEARYKSVVVEGRGPALLTMAAYIDLNAVRAGLVDDPKDYRYCGYGEAVAGSQKAREGLKITAEELGRSTDWRMVQRTYRKLVYAYGEKSGAAKSGGATQPGFAREDAARVWENDGELKPVELLHCRIRYFSDGVALGSRGFVESLFESRRNHFGSKRESGARRVKGRAFDGLFSLRDLKVRVVT